MKQEYFSDWDFVMSLMPSGWKEKFKELKVLKFGRKFTGADKESKLLRVLMLHLGTGASLRETSVLATEGKIADISDVGILKRLRKSEDFFVWCINSFLEDSRIKELNNLSNGLRFRILDASVVTEPGATGSNWRLHYSLDMKTLRCDEIKITDAKTGEGVKNFSVAQNEVILADRAYGRRTNIELLSDAGAYTLCRFSPQHLPLHTTDGLASFQLLPNLRKLEFGETGEWDVSIKYPDGHLISGRVCAVKKTPEAAEKSKKKVRRQSVLAQTKLQPKTLEYAEYTLIFTTLPPATFPAENIMKIYRLRWQIEILFKRLKSILSLGHLHKYDEQSVRAWLSGKIFTALLIERIIKAGESFFP
ncbi:MAG: hypothetical protein A2Y12_20770 [Planctomycetes bacterium GWF2_42_9]|nr:MAG: hypothetical protein A2Y12_20770 [Planctomycetes bacterium GWF2_42_9]